MSAQGHVAGSEVVLPVEVEVTTEYYFEESELDPGLNQTHSAKLRSKRRQDFEPGTTT